MAKQQPIVTRHSLEHMLRTASKEKQVQIIGRALVVMYRNQTANERQVKTTHEENGVGFTAFDATHGTCDAEYFLKHNTLLGYQIQRWTRLTRGAPAICKYHRQLNAAALEKQMKSS